MGPRPESAPIALGGCSIQVFAPIGKAGDEISRPSNGRDIATSQRLRTAMRPLAKIIVLSFVIVLGWKTMPSIEQVLLSPIRVVQGVASTVELHNIQKALRARQILDGRRLEPKEFPRFIEASFDSKFKDPTLDFWGNPYQYRLLTVGYEVRSCGPDGLARSVDDLVIRGEETNA